MNKITQKLLLVFIAVCAIGSCAKAQSYSIESFEGHKVNIRLTEKATAQSWYGATVSYLTSRIILDDYDGIKEVHVLNRKFLEITYDVRGGSNILLRNTVILYVRRNKINVAILVESFGKAFGGDIDGSLYVVTFNIIGNNESDYKLIAHIHDRKRSNSLPQNNYIKDKKLILTFNSSQNIFYSTYKRINQTFIINSSQTPHTYKQQVSGLIPFIAFNQNHYYYINGEWYRGNDNNLFNDYYR